MRKTVFRKSKFVGKLALKDCFIWSVYTIKTSKLAFLCIHVKVVPGKVVLFLYKKFLDQNFSKNSVFESFVVQRVTFWFKKFKCVRVRSVLSQLDRFRIESFRTSQFSKKNFTTQQILKLNWFVKKNRFWWKFFSEKIFLDRFTPKNANFCSYAFYQKPTIVLRKGKKNSFPIKIFEKIRFWNQFSTTSEIRIKFFKMEQFFGELYTTRHFLYRKFYSVSDFETSFYHTSGFERKF